MFRSNTRNYICVSKKNIYIKDQIYFRESVHIQNDSQEIQTDRHANSCIAELRRRECCAIIIQRIFATDLRNEQKLCLKHRSRLIDSNRVEACNSCIKEQNIYVTNELSLESIEQQFLAKLQRNIVENNTGKSR